MRAEERAEFSLLLDHIREVDCTFRLGESIRVRESEYDAWEPVLWVRDPDGDPCCIFIGEHWVLEWNETTQYFIRRVREEKESFDSDWERLGIEQWETRW